MPPQHAKPWPLAAINRDSIMKQTLLLLVIFLIAINTKSQDLSKHVSPDRFENPKTILIKNKIKNQTVFEFSSFKRNSDSIKINEKTYDSDENLISENTFSLGKLSIRESYIYSNDKKLYKINQEFLKPNNTWTKQYVYDSAGNEIKEYSYNIDTTALIIIMNIYNNKNQLSECYRKENNDSFRLSKKYYYNENGIATKIEIYNSKGILSAGYSYIVDTNNYYKVAYFQNTEDPKQKEEFIFNKANQCIKVNGFARQPIVHIDDDNNYARKVEIKIISETEEYEYNIDGTLFQVKTTIDKKLNKVRRYYYTNY